MTAVKPRLVILPGGVRADQPAAASVAEGALYFVTDEGVLERNNGTSWDNYSGGAVMTFTPTAVPFADGSGVLTEDPTKFVYDNANDALQVPKVVGGTGTGSELTLQSTTGVGDTTSRVVLGTGDNGAAVVEMRVGPDSQFPVMGIGTKVGAFQLYSLAAPLNIYGAGADIGYLIRARPHYSGAHNKDGYVQVESAGGSWPSANAGFTFHQPTNEVEWRMAVSGGENNAMRWIANQYGIATSTTVAYVTVRGNIILDTTRNEPTTGTKAVVLGIGTTPATMAANTAAVFTRDDAAGYAQLCAINENGNITQLSGLRPVVLVKKSGTQTLTTGVRTAIAFDVEAFDVGACHDNSTNNTRLTVPTGADGTYFITANVEYAANSSGLRAAQLVQNALTNLAQVIVTPVVGDITVVQVIAVAPLVAGDYVELNGLQTSGGNLTVGNDSSAFSWTRL